MSALYPNVPAVGDAAGFAFAGFDVGDDVNLSDADLSADNSILSGRLQKKMQDQLLWLTLVTPPRRLIVSKSANQSVANTTRFALAFDTVEEGKGTDAANVAHDIPGAPVPNDALTNLHTSATIAATIVTAGLYEICAEVAWASSTGDRELRVLINGAADAIGGIETRPAAGVAMTQQVRLLKRLAVNDTVQIDAWQNSGGAINVTGVRASLVRVAL